MANGSKNPFFSYHNNGCYEQKLLHQKLESYKFKHFNNHCKNWVGWVSARWNKRSEPQKRIFSEKGYQR